MTLFTLGYEGATAGAFVARLKAAGVKTVVDVRELPLSRKPGFSKSALARILHQAGIAYVHLAELGCPKPIRDRYRTDGDWSAYTRAFRTYLARQDGAVSELVRIAMSTTACLVCFESDFNRCHRSIVARSAARLGDFSIVHLTLKEETVDVAGQLAA
jgi:uncharacterized protein (DUF488 family)